MGKTAKLTDLTDSTRKYLKILQNLGWNHEEIANHTGLPLDSIKKALAE